MVATYFHVITQPLSPNLSFSLPRFIYKHNFYLYIKWSRLVTVRYSNGDLNTEPFEYRTTKSSVFECFCYSNVRYSDPHCNVKEGKFGDLYGHRCITVTI